VDQVGVSLGGYKSGLNVLGTDLPLLATKAAIELELYSENKNDDLTSVQTLSELIKNSIDLKDTNTPRSLMDPSTVTVMSKAIGDSKWNATPKTIDELVKIAIKLAEELGREPDQSKRNGEVQKIKEFCIALAKCSSAHRQSIFGHSSKHPFRA